jgi:T5SS/PEP-CTERM-associated repeat protein
MLKLCASRCRPLMCLAAIESVERRWLLSVAPVAADDAYELGPDHGLSVDVTAPTPGQPFPLPAFDMTPSPAPAGPFTEPDFVRTVEGGQVVSEPRYVEIADAAGSFGSITVRGAGSRWVVGEWLELAQGGKATMTVTDRGSAVINNWLNAAVHGLAEITVSNGGTVDTANWAGIGSAETGSSGGGSATLTVTGPQSRWTSRGSVAVGYGRSRGTLRVQDGATFRTNDWMEVGDNGGRGEVSVAGGGLVGTANFAVVGDNGGFGTVTVSGANSRWTVGNWMEVGTNRSRGVLTLSDGGTVSTNNWAEIGRYDGSDGRVLVGSGSTFSFKEFLSVGVSIAGTSRGTLYVAEGGRVVNAGGQGFGRGPEIINSFGGRILGGGSVQGLVTNAGVISPGGSVGVLTIVGTLHQPSALGTPEVGRNPNGRLLFDIGGTARGTAYDGLNVTGAANIAGGTVALNFVNGFAPRSGDRFTLIDAASTTFAPAAVEVRGLAPGFQYTLAVENGDLVLVANSDGTPAPVIVQRKGVLANDTDADGDALTAVLTRGPAHGTVTLYRDGSFHYTPDPSFTGTDTFEYFADDGVFTSAPAVVTVRNLPPVARDDAYATEEDSPLSVAAAAGVLANDSDSVSPTLTASLVEGPRNGTLTLNPDGSFVYTPRQDFSGSDAFTYRASDGTVSSEPATVTLTVRPVNDAPVAVADRLSVRQGRTLSVPVSALLANDTDPDGDTLRVTGVSATGDTHGMVALSGGRVTYTPDRRFTGPASFTYSVSDGRGGTAQGTVHVTVLPRQRGTPGSASGRGSIDGRRGTFVFGYVARTDGQGLSIRGMLLYQDRSRGVSLRATDADLFEISRNGREVTFAGTAAVNGTPGYRFEVTAEDKSRSGHNDRFRIRISGPPGSDFSYDSNASSRHVGRIDRGGNVVIEKAEDDEGDDD